MERATTVRGVPGRGIRPASRRSLGPGAWTTHRAGRCRRLQFPPEVPMPLMMKVQRQVRQSRVQVLHARRPGWHGEVSYAAGLLSSTDLLLGVEAVAAGRSMAVRPEAVEVVVTPGWLADLHDPTLVISHAYVGPDRRRVDQSTPPEPSWRSRLVRRIAQVVCMTAVAVPLTMTVNRSVPPATTGTPPAAIRESATVAGMPGHRSPHLSTVSRRKATWAGAAPRRALAHRHARQVVAGVGTLDAVGSNAEPALRSAARALAAQSRATGRAQTRAVAAQLRADQRAAKAAGGGHPFGRRHLTRDRS